MKCPKSMSECPQTARTGISKPLVFTTLLAQVWPGKKEPNNLKKLK
jgi:hypothetical protein